MEKLNGFSLLFLPFYEHGDLFAVQIDHEEQKTKMSEKQHNRSGFAYFFLDGNKIDPIDHYLFCLKISQTRKEIYNEMEYLLDISLTLIRVT